MLFFPLLLLAGLSTGQDVYPPAVQQEFAPPAADLAPVADLAQPPAAAPPPTIWIDHRSANPDKGPVPATLQYQPANPDTSHSSVPVYQTTDVDYGQWQQQPLPDYDAYQSQPQPLGTYYPPQQQQAYQPPPRDLGYPSVGGGIGASFPSGLLNPHNLFVWGLGALIIMLTVNVLYDVMTKLTAGPLATARDWLMSDDVLVNEAAGRSLGNMAGYVMNAIDKYSQLDE